MAGYPYTITASKLRDLIVCERLPYMDEFAPRDEWRRSPEAERAIDMGERHESAAAQRLLSAADADGRETFRPASDRLPSREETMRAMRRGVDEIHQGLLGADQWFGRPDLLRRIPGKSSLGAWHYMPIDMKGVSRVSKAELIPVGFYSLLLERVQGRRPDHFSIFKWDGWQTFATNDHAPAILESVARLDTLLARKKDPGPFLRSECRKCPWFARCQKDAERIGHLSLVRGLQRPLAQRLEAEGIRTIRDLAASDPDNLVGPQLQDFSRAHVLVAQAQSLVRKRPLVIGAHLLPDSAPIEAFVDCETGGFNDGSDVFLWGVMIRRGKRVTFSQSWASTRRGNRRAWTQFVNVVRSLPRLTPLFHFGSLERSMIEKGLELFGGAADAFTRLHDLQHPIQKSIVLPEKNSGLKQISKALGYKWRKEMTGLDAANEYFAWQRSRNPRLKKRIIEYNRDDLRALAHVLDRLRSHRSNRMGAPRSRLGLVDPEVVWAGF